MRVESAGARTWLLAAVALWAACTWVLAAAGLGGRVQALPAEPALLQPLPPVDAVAAGRIGPLPQYAEISERPLFSPDRRHRPFLIDPDGGGDPADGFDLVLTSVLITPGLEMAIVEPARGGDAIRFRVGESARQAPDWTLLSVAPRSATFAGPEGERVLPLRAFDGVGGAPPTGVGAEGAPADARADAGVDAQADAEEQAGAIRRRIEERRARVREQRERQSQAPVPAPARENP